MAAATFSSSLATRNGEGDPRAKFRSGALGRYFASVRLHYPFTDRKVQTCSLNLAPSFVTIGPGELPEQVR